MGIVNDHTTALVPIETWAYQSPRLRREGHLLDIGLLAEALIYYDRIILVPSTDASIAKVLPYGTAPPPTPHVVPTPLFVDLIEWFVTHGFLNDFVRLIADGTVRIYHYAFRATAVENDGLYDVLNVQEEGENSGDAFIRRVLYHPTLAKIIPKGRIRQRLYKAVQGHFIEVTADQFGRAVNNAKRDILDQATARGAVQAFLDDAYDIAGFSAPPTVEVSITAVENRQTLTWNLDFNAISKAVGSSVGFNSGLVLSGLLQANRTLWSAATESTDLYLPSPLSRLASQKLSEANDRRLGPAQIIGELEAKVEFPDVRSLVNSGTLSFRDVLKLRQNARQFRTWLQTQTDRDRDALIAYHNEVARRSGFNRGARKTLQLFGVVTGTVAGNYFGGPVGAAIGGAAIDESVRYVFDLAGKLEDWRPVVFGDWARDYVDRVQTSGRKT